MNNKHIFDLTVRLSQALDQNYDVVNMEAVISVISSLEGTTITKEQLEATRLAKYINQLRRRTKSEHLARRAKSLLKKWREMVGIQQTNEPSSSNVSLVTNDNAVSAKLQHHPRSQPTSPNEGMSLESASNSKANSNADFLRSTVSNPSPTVSSLTRSANLNVNSDKLDFAERRIAACVSTIAVPTDSGKQPTSFANLLSGFCGENNAKVSTISALEPTGTSPHSTRKFIKLKERELEKPTETFTVDQSSNSNSEIMSTPAIHSTSVPVIINIQDSNSGSNPITPTTVAIDSSYQQILSKTTSKKIALLGPIPKQKKTKKEKKRKERDTQTSTQSEVNPSRFNESVANDETSSNQNHQSNVEGGKFVPIIEDKSRMLFPNSNISGILSLSNSSLSSNELGFVRVVEEKVEFDLNASSRLFSSDLSTSDLTFAGKFKHQNNTNMTPLLKNVETITLNGADITCTEMPNSEITKAVFTPKLAPLKFVPFSDSGCNSNDSTSNSRASQFDVIDIGNQYRNQSKLSQDILPSKKLDTVCNVVTQEPQKTPTENNLILPITIALPLDVDVSEINDSLNAVDNIQKKIPKKRGRKKGSKGVDSVIAKESSLSSQMFITALGSGGKKVKTTKELYAEMQNRKKSIVSATTSSSSPTLMNWAAQLQSTSRPGSSCSEPSLHSPGTLDACSTNATMSTLPTQSAPERDLNNANGDEGESDSDTATSEPSRDSTAVQANHKADICAESNNYKNSPANKTYGYKQIEALATAVERQLLELLKQLPMAPNIKDIEAERAADFLSCTCRIIEVMAQPDELLQPASDSVMSQDQALLVKAHTTTNSSESEPIVAINITKEEPFDLKSIGNKSPKPLKQQKPKKSIFDLDFEDDEDPLQLLMAESVGVSAKNDNALQGNSSMTTKAETSVISELTMQSSLPNESAKDLNLIHTQSTLLMPIFPSYQVEEDPNCAAKQRFEIQTQKITNFHIDALHNCYIANVNGNWDNADTVNRRLSTEIGKEGENEELASNVVPKYGALLNERINKDLSYICFTKNFKPKIHSTARQKLYGMPFLGMARRSEKRKRSPEHSHNACHKAKISAANNSNINLNEKSLNNICLNIKLQENVDNDFTNIDTCANNIHEIVQKESVFDSNIRNIYLNDDITKINSLNIMGTNNNVVLKDITLDIIDEVLDNELSRISNENACSQNLLAIAHNLNYSNHHSILATVDDLNKCKINLKTNISLSMAESQNYNATTYTATELETNAVNFAKGNDNNPIVFFNKSRESLQLDCSLVNHTKDKPVNNEHVSSRRSSSCSNSSLKQTQHSINMKLRHQRLLEQEEQKLADGNKRKHKRKRTDKKKRKHYNHPDNEYNEKPPIIKRIKIAINGDIATQRQISLSSCNSSSDDDGSSEKISDGATLADESEEVIDENQDSLNSTISRSSTVDYEDNNSKEECIDSLEPDEDEDAEFDDDDEDYSGDYHEVVTRDISAPSNSNNHIVLTIKKTPSKTNSPSNSLSAMSPVITSATNAAINTTTTATTCTAPGNVLSSTFKNSNASDSNPADKSANVNMDETLTANIEDGKTAGFGTARRNTSETENKNCDRIIAPMSPLIVKNPTFSEKLTKLNLRRRHLRRRVKQLQPFKFPNETVKNIGRVKKKLHKQLFFSHEIYVRVDDEHTDTTLNISSCSSNCSDDSEYESYISSADDDDNVVTECKSVNGESDTNSLLQFRIQKKRICTPSTSDCSSLSSYESTVSDSVAATTNFANVSKYLRKDQANVICHVNSSVETDQSPKTKFDEDFAEDAPTPSGQGNCKAVCNNEQDFTTEAKIEPSEENYHCDELLENNNGLLMSFNNIFHSPNAMKLIENIDKIGVVYDAQQVNRYDEQLRQQLPNENCDDDYNNLYNNNNTLNLMKYDCNEYRLENNDSCNNRNKEINCNSDDIQFVDNDKSVNITSSENTDKYKNDDLRKKRQLIPHKEYRTGMRAVDEDVDDDEGNNCARIQQFKEWHHVLQLRSYNDELLTVLPYVVLD